LPIESRVTLDRSAVDQTVKLATVLINTPLADATLNAFLPSLIYGYYAGRVHVLLRNRGSDRKALRDDNTHLSDY